MLLIEAHARFAYTASLAAVQKLLTSHEEVSPVREAQIRPLIGGMPRRRLEPTGQQSVLSYSWFSFFRRYHIHLRLDEDQVVTTLTTGDSIVPTDSPAADVLEARRKFDERIARDRQLRTDEAIFDDVKLPEKHRFDDKAIAKVKQLLGEDAWSRPLKRDARRIAAIEQEERQWLQELYVGSFGQYTVCPKALQSRATDFLKQFAAFDFKPRDGSNELAARRLVAEGTALADAECQDPIVYYGLGVLYEVFDQAVNQEWLNKSSIAFAESAYPFEVALQVTLPHANAKRWGVLYSGYRRRQPEITAESMLTAKSHPLARVFLYRRCQRFAPWHTYGLSREFLTAVYGVPEFDSWLKWMLTGRFCEAASDFQWDTDPRRKTFNANTFDPMMPKESERQMKYAVWGQARYLDAWKLDPTLPGSAAGILACAKSQWRLMQYMGQTPEPRTGIRSSEPYVPGVTTASSSRELRFWLGEAVAACFDEPALYENYRDVLLRHHSPNSKMEKVLHFGRECLDTEQFDTKVPAIYLDLLAIFQTIPGQVVYSLPNVYADCERIIRGYLGQTTSNAERTALETQLLCIAIYARQRQMVGELVTKLGDRIDVPTLQRYHMRQADVAEWLPGRHPNTRRWPQIDGPVDGVTFEGNTLLALETTGDHSRITALGSAVQAFSLDRNRDARLRTMAAPSGSLVVTYDTLGHIALWDRSTGQRTQSLDVPGPVETLAISPDENVLIACSASMMDGKSGVVHVWDRNGQLLAKHENPSGFVHSLAFAGDGRTLVMASNSRDGQFEWRPGNLEFWDFRADRVEHRLIPFQIATNAVATSATGQWLAVAGEDSNDLDSMIYLNRFGHRPSSVKVQLLNLATAEVQRTLLHDEGHGVAMAFLSDGQYLATAGPDFNVRLWRCDTGESIALLAGHHDPIAELAVSEDGMQLATRDIAGCIRLWKVAAENTRSAVQASLPTYRFQDVVRVLAIPYGNLLATGTFREGVIIWNLDDHGTAAGIVPPPDGTILLDFDVSRDGRLIAIAGGSQPPYQIGPPREAGGFVQVWDRNTSELVWESRELPASVTTVRFSPDGKMLATGRQDSSIVLWDLQTHVPFDWGTLTEHPGIVSGLAFSSDGTRLASIDRSRSEGSTRRFGNVKLWRLPEDRHAPGLRLASEKSLSTFERYGFGCSSVQFSPDSRSLLVFGTSEGRLIDVESWSTVKEIGDPTGTFSGSGSRILSMNRQRVRFWETGVNTVPTESAIGPKAKWRCAAASHDEHRFFIANEDEQSIMLWDAHLGKEVASWLSDELAQ